MISYHDSCATSSHDGLFKKLSVAKNPINRGPSVIDRQSKAHVSLHHPLPNTIMMAFPEQAKHAWIPTPFRVCLSSCACQPSACHCRGCRPPSGTASQSTTILPSGQQAAIHRQRPACDDSCLCSTAFRLVPWLDLARPAASLSRHGVQAQGGSGNGLQSAQHPISEFHTFRSAPCLQSFPRAVTEGTSS